MSSKTSRGAVRKRTHNLGGCSTCRRRHVKCDRTKPACTVCQKAGISCDGYPSQIRWASTATGPPVRKATQPPGPRAEIPKHPIIRSSQHESPTPEDINTSSTIEALSDEQTHLSPEVYTIQPQPTQNDIIFNSDNDIFSYPSAGSLSDLESLFDSSGGLGWSDLFDSNMTFSMPLIQDQAYDDPLGILAHVASQPQNVENDHRIFEGLPTHGQSRPFMDVLTPSLDLQPPPYAPRDISEVEILDHARLLLKHFRDSVIPQFAPLPANARSPWEILNWSAAVQTLADMTYLQSPNIRHANMANLFAILGCAAYTITATQRYADLLPLDQGMSILDYALRRAKGHMQESLRTETSGASKAKYKDQLMAIFSLIALATLNGNSMEARCYLIDAERLLRVRGLAKREVSRRARLLHHVYTWLRIIGESTFTLHEHNGSGLQEKLEKMIRNHRSASNTTSGTSKQTASAEEHAQLDDFLRVEAHGSESESDAESAKDEATGLRDIHLSDLRTWSNTLYMDIYGIPEIWLSLVSQTTRVANILDLLDRPSLQVPRTFTNSVQRKTNKLEHVICSFSAQYSMHRPITSRDDGQRSGATTPRSPPASQAMLRAMGSALLIFFYRRIRKVHPWILQTHVNDVIAALKEFDSIQGVIDVKTTGTPWPAFIAGCEAISQSSREWLMTWLQQGSEQSGFNSFASSQRVMREVWEKRDAALMSSGKEHDQSAHGKKGEVVSWVDILRESKSWLMLY